MHRHTRIYVAGHRGMVGSTLVRRLRVGGYGNVLVASRAELDLLDQRAVHTFLAREKPDYVFVAAAKVGGILANSLQPADFIHQNLVIGAHLVHGAHLAGVQRLMFLESSCTSPRDCPQPIREEYLLTGPLEPSNEAYAVAKIAGIKLCESYSRQHGRQYVSVMTCNLYGPGDNYDLASSQVLPALLRKAHEATLRGASELVVWGSGAARREFLYVDDLADACVHLMERDWSGGLLNIGSGEDVTIREFAGTVMEVAGFQRRIVFDASEPDGTPRKLHDASRLATLGSHAQAGPARGHPAGVRRGAMAALSPFLRLSPISDARKESCLHHRRDGLGRYLFSRAAAGPRLRNARHQALCQFVPHRRHRPPRPGLPRVGRALHVALRRPHGLLEPERQTHDVVIATGGQYSVREFVEHTAARLGMSLRFEGKGAAEVGIVERADAQDCAVKPGAVVARVDPRYFRPIEVRRLCGDASRARQQLGWAPDVGFEALVQEMADSDFVAAQRELRSGRRIAKWDHHE